MQTLPIDYVGLWHKSRLSVHDVIEKDPEVLKVGDVTICALGNFSASINAFCYPLTYFITEISGQFSPVIILSAGEKIRDRGFVLMTDMEKNLKSASNPPKEF